MNPDPSDQTLLRRLAWTGAGLTLGLIVLGGVVRITGSGLGCGDHWPMCNGQWFPPLDLPTMIEIGHRWAAALVSLSVLGLAVTAWVRHRHQPALRRPATLALALLVVQVLLGAVTVKLALPPWVIIAHLANAMLLLATLLVTALRATVPEASTPLDRGGRHGAHSLVVVTAALGFGVILLGAQVANFHAGLLCLGLPLCNGALLPPEAPLAALHWTHRVFAFAFLALVVVMVMRVRDAAGPEGARLRNSARLVLGGDGHPDRGGGGDGAQPPAAGASGAPPLRGIGGLGDAGGARLFLGADPEGARVKGTGRPTLAADLVTLTKPRIISLLLVTTLAPMFITPAGLPSLSQLWWVALGGYLMAGGANAINMWFDRDIDSTMTRTRLRPIPSGRMSPAAGLAFGIGLGAAAFAIFWFLVNPLSAYLALGGLLFYVFIYTMWLKRTSPQNIVIGGAAGAFPPLVGWAAMTGRLDLAAIYLFAIIFYWTPPHFWALALIKQADYARAGVPMMPVVRGEARTKYEMLVYTLVLLPLTIMPTFFGALGIFYGVAAALLGARLLWYCVRLIRQPGVTPVAWQMYRYSLLYLALLFVAMGVDHALPFGHRPPPEQVIILDRPENVVTAPSLQR